MSHYRPRDGKDGIPGTHGKDGRDGEMGEPGPAPEHEWDGTALRFQDPDGTWGDFVDLEGPAGKDGKDGRDGKDGTNGKDGRDGRDGTNGRNGGRGAVGPMPEHEWNGTSLRFEEPDGEWGPYVNLKGEKGEPGRNGVGGMGPPGPPGPPGSGSIVAGDGIDAQTVGDVTTVSHGDTSSIADFANGFTDGVVMQQIALTYDEFGHAQTVGVLGIDLDDRYVKLGDLTNTDDLPEGSTNLYFTDSRAIAALGNGGGEGTTGQFLRGDNLWSNVLLYGGATHSAPAAGVKIVSENNTTPQMFEVITTGAGTTFGADICSTAYEDVGGGGVMHIRRARGTLASPSALLSGDIIGGISGRSYHSGGAFQNSGPASIHWVASEDQTVSAFGSYMRFYTTPQGSTTRIERLVMTDVGATWSLGSGTFDPKSAAQTQPFGTNTHRFLASAVDEASRITSIAYGGSNASAHINLCRAQGTASAPTAILNEDIIGFISGIGYDGSAWEASALIRFAASGNWSGSARGADIQFETTAAGTTSRSLKVRIHNDGRLSGTALHNNAGSVTGTTTQYIASGTWTPTLTNSTNITSSTASVCQWTRVGNVVNFSGRVTFDPTAVGLIQLGMSLPIPSNFTAVEQAGGTGASNNEFFRIYADATNDRLMIESIIKADVASSGFHFSGSYLVN